MKNHFKAASAVILFCAGLVGAQCPPGDLDGNCQVNAGDLQILSGQWLAPPESPADLNGDDRVDLADLGLVAAGWGAQGIPLFINEVMASNATAVQDPQDDYDDWIELYNASDQPLSIAGMYLTDDLSAPMKWRVSADDRLSTTIPPRGHLLIWADGDVLDPGLHASFALSADGDEVALFDTDGVTLIDHVGFDAQLTDISYGRLPDGGDTWQFFASPTPGAENAAVYEGFAAEPVFSVERGFYDEEIVVALTTETADATIYYTTDGSEPYEIKGRGPNGKIYREPLPITKTTVLRAKAIKTGWRSSPTKTCTYLFVGDVIRQSASGQRPASDWPSSAVNGQVIDYGMDPDIVKHSTYSDQIVESLLSIPSVSLVTDVDHLFDPSTGIYVHPSSEGRRWERPVSVELLNPDASEGFQIDAGLRIRGGFSRSTSNPKHAFRLLFRPEYGGALEFPLFGDEGADHFENVDLRTSQNYSWSFQGDSQNSMVREVFSRDTQGQLGHPYTRSRYYHLYINGQYWGLYQTQERSEASYAESYFGGDEDDYDVMKVDRSVGRSMWATDGNTDAYRRLYDATLAGLDDSERYLRVQGLDPDETRNPDYERLLDVENLIDFMIIEYFTGDRDGPGSRFGNIPNNCYAIFDRANPDGWKWFHHDNEHTLGVSSSETNMVTPFTWAGVQWRYFNPHWLHEQLAMSNTDYRIRFADRVYRHFFNDGLLTAEAAIARIERRAEQIETAIIAESARWGDSRRSSPFTKQHWESQINRIVNNYLPTRVQVVLDQLRSVGWYPSIDPPTFNPHGGHVPSDFLLQMSGTTGAIYYTLDGSDPRGEITSDGDDGDPPTTLVAMEAGKKVTVPTGEIDEAWKGGAFFNDRIWTSAAGEPGGVGYERSSGYETYIGLDLSSKMYQQHTSCYIRIPFTAGADHNRFDTMTLHMLYDDGFVAYLNGVEILRANAPAALAWNSAAVSSREVFGIESFDVSDHIALLNEGDNLLAIHGLNSSTTSSDFLISAALEARVEVVNNDPGVVSAGASRYTGPIPLSGSTQVKAAALSGATWSALNEVTFAVGPVAENLRISEMMYHPAETGHPDDPNTEYIELTNIGTEPINLNLVAFTNGVDFTFDSLELAPGQYTLVVRNIAAFEVMYGAGLPIAGQYDGRLSNAGERVTLQDAAGQVIHNFRFRDGWYDLTDGAGFSLTVQDPGTIEVNGLNEEAAWRPSANPGGSPGFDDANAP